MISRIAFILLFMSSFYLSGFYGKYFYVLLMQTHYMFVMWFPIAVFAICLCFYLFGLMSRRSNLGVWLALWETNAFLALMESRTHLNFRVFNEAVWVGIVFLLVGFTIFAVGFDILYTEFIAVPPGR